MSSNETLANIVYAIIFLCVIVGIFVVTILRVKHYKGKLDLDTFEDMPSFEYVIGNTLQFGEYGSMNGIAIKLPCAVPNLILDSHKNDEAFVGLPFHPSESQRIELEGDFDQHFSLYVHKNDATEALSLITPDVMQTLKGRADGVDILFRDNTLYLITVENIGNEVNREKLLAIAKIILEEMTRWMKTSGQGKDNKAYSQLQIVDDASLKVRKTSLPLELSLAVFTTVLLFTVMIIGSKLSSNEGSSSLIDYLVMGVFSLLGGFAVWRGLKTYLTFRI